MVEIWPFAERSHGIAFFQLFGRLAGFFTTFVNPIGLSNAGWKYLISYCCFLAYEIVFVYFMFPETFGRTLEELAFRKFSRYCRLDYPKSTGGGFLSQMGSIILTSYPPPQYSRIRHSPRRPITPLRRWSATMMRAQSGRGSLPTWKSRDWISKVHAWWRIGEGDLRLFLRS